MEKFLRALLQGIFFALPFLFSVNTCMATEIPTQQYQTLKSNNEALVLKLETLQLICEKLKTPSMELAAQLTECRADLQKVNGLLLTTQEKLAISQKSLANAEALQKKTEQSLMLLEKQINSLKHKYRRQNAIAWTVAGTLLIIVAKNYPKEH